MAKGLIFRGKSGIILKKSHEIVFEKENRILLEKIIFYIRAMKLLLEFFIEYLGVVFYNV